MRRKETKSRRAGGLPSGLAALLFLACHIVLTFGIENMQAWEEMVCERHGREPAGL